jgi:hypothetical protein
MSILACGLPYEKNQDIAAEMNEMRGYCYGEAALTYYGKCDIA